MGKTTGFMEYTRTVAVTRPAPERVFDWQEFHEHMPETSLREQGARCMDCGVPFCHTGQIINGASSGCPINNLIPEWNDLVYRGQWREALDRLRQSAQSRRPPGDGLRTRGSGRRVVDVRHSQHEIGEDRGPTAPRSDVRGRHPVFDGNKRGRGLSSRAAYGRV